MRHPSKIGAFCSRKGDRHPTSGAPRSGQHLREREASKAGPNNGWPFWKRLHARRIRDPIAREKRNAVKRQKAARAA